jgi:hypothetical protein
VGQKKEDRIEDINAAAVVYANYSKSRFQRQRCLRCQRKEQERGEETAEALHRNGAGWSSGTPTGLWATKIGGFSLCLCTMRENCARDKVGDALEIYGKYGGRECRARQNAWRAARCACEDGGCWV